MLHDTFVLYDADCPLCKMFAEFSIKHSNGELRFESWQAFRKSEAAESVLSQDVLAQPPDRLRVWHQGEIYEQAAAWEYLLMHHPQLKTLGWLAEKMGVSKPTAKIIHKTAAISRRLCLRCPTW